MFSSFFGSYSKTTAWDLYNLNVRSVHTTLHLYELRNGKIINHNVTTLPIKEHIEEGFVAQCFNKKYPDSYTVGFLVDIDSKVTNTHLNSFNKVSILDTFKGKPLDYCIDRKKEFLYISVSENTIGIFLGNKQRLYVDGFGSFSETPMSEYDELRTEFMYFITLRKEKEINNDQ